MKKNILLLFSLSLLFSGCARILVSRKQSITITTTQDSAKIYLNNEGFGIGKSATGKTRRDGPKQIIIKTPGYKDTYGAMVATKRPTGYWFLFPLNCVFITAAPIAMIVDACSFSKLGYRKIHEVPVSEKIITHKPHEKYIEISNISANIKENDLKEFDLTHSDDLYLKIDAVLRKDAFEIKKLESTNTKSNNKSTTLDTVSKISYDNTLFTKSVFNTLRKSGYIDTVNTIFADNNNTIILEGNIKKVYVFNVYGKGWASNNYYHKSLLHITWYMKNSYNELLDSIETTQYSGDFSQAYKYKSSYTTNGQSYENIYQKMYGDAIDISYLKLHTNSKFTKYLKQETNLTISDPILSIPNPNNVVTDKDDAFKASVIVKTKDGHGSGFAITNDGYILTNYHVIAGRINGKIGAIKIINANGEEAEATIVRYNKYRDLALIKVSKTFEKAFKFSDVKAFKNFQDVYTIGAPKSIELGQSISLGVISNERNSNNNKLLQLNMSVNSGNSGGPLFDTNGNLHGMIVSKLVGASTEGVSFAIPAYLTQEYLHINYK